jgi:tetratricopeptide (TPR) repeat protein
MLRRSFLQEGTVCRVRAVAFLAGWALVASACAPPARVAAVSVSDQDLKIREAEALVRKGHYLAFKSAVQIYDELSAKPSLRPKIASPYLEAVLLFALREKDIGIDDPATLRSAADLIAANPGLAGMKPYLTLIGRMPTRTKGVMRDIDTSGWNAAGAEELNAAEAAVEKSAATSEFAACVRAAWSCSYGRYSEKWRSASECLKLHPDSLLIEYELAVCGDADEAALKELLAREPDFAEAHFHLGGAALGRGKLIEAESELLKAYAAIPESPQTRILLAGIYFATEEFDKSLEFYDLALAVSLEYRDALLGKAICLSYLGRHEDAVQVLDRMLDLGYWLLGEAHFWIAWNLHELHRDDEALRHVDEAKGRLPTNSEVFSLAGTIALDLGQDGRAEKDFLEALKYNPDNRESLFGLGTLAGRKNLWRESGGYYEKAAGACAASESALQARIEEIRNSALSPERKERLVRKREAQIDGLRLTEATSYYNAAAAYLNGDLKDKAAVCAGRAAAHPVLKAKAEELLRSIKK